MNIFLPGDLLLSVALTSRSRLKLIKLCMLSGLSGGTTFWIPSLTATRREATALPSATSKNIYPDFSFIDLKATRFALLYHGTARHIMLAALDSDSVANVIFPTNAVACAAFVATHVVLSSLVLRLLTCR